MTPAAVTAKLQYKPKSIPLSAAQFYLAVIVVCGFLLALLTPIFAVAVGAMPEAEGADFVKTIASVTAGPVGAVLGFYYSSNRD